MTINNCDLTIPDADLNPPGASDDQIACILRARVTELDNIVTCINDTSKTCEEKQACIDAHHDTFEQQYQQCLASP